MTHQSKALAIRVLNDMLADPAINTARKHVLQDVLNAIEEPVVVTIESGTVVSSEHDYIDVVVTDHDNDMNGEGEDAE